MTSTTANMALFIDFENKPTPDFPLKALMDKLAGLGKLLIKRAYADWGELLSGKSQFVEAAVETIEVPSTRRGKNSADIQLVVEAMRTAYENRNISTFVIHSGDTDFVPLVSFLRSVGKQVVVVDGNNIPNQLLKANADIYFRHQDLTAEQKMEKAEREIKLAIKRAHEAYRKLKTKKIEPTVSRLKEAMMQRTPGFDEKKLGFDNMTALLKQAGIPVIQTPKASLHNSPSTELEVIGKCVRSIARRMQDQGVALNNSTLKTELCTLAPKFAEKDFGFKKFSEFLHAVGVNLEPITTGYMQTQPTNGTAATVQGYDYDRSVLLTKETISWMKTMRQQPTVSTLKSTLLAHYPMFDHRTLGFVKFSDFLNHAQIKVPLDFKAVAST